MARTKDSEHVAEAVRTQEREGLWHLVNRGHRNLGAGGTWVMYQTDYAEQLMVVYGPSGKLVEAEYRHWDGSGNEVSQVLITQDKRKRVIDIINGKLVTA